MGHKSNAIANRLGYIRGWESNWFAPKKEFASLLLEDQKIRRLINEQVPQKVVSRIVIERLLQAIVITIHTSKPGVLIGAGGATVQKLKEHLKNQLPPGKEVRLNVLEVKNPEIDAPLVAKDIKEQLEAGLPYKRAMKRAIENAMRAGAEGIRITLSGRLARAELARTEDRKEGRVPLHTFRADIDYALAEAGTTHGKIGVKVRIFKGEVYGKRDLSLNNIPATTKRRMPPVPRAPR